jgi:hypothetical protein
LNLLLTIPPLLHKHLPPSPEVCDSPEQAARQILSLSIVGNRQHLRPALGWLGRTTTACNCQQQQHGRRSRGSLCTAQGSILELRYRKIGSV